MEESMRKPLTLALTTLALVAASSVARAEGAVDLPESDTQELQVVAGNDSAVVSYAFRLPNGVAPTGVFVTSVMRENHPQPLGNTLTAEPADDPHRGEILKLTVGLGAPIEQGTYAVRVRFDTAAEPLFATVKVVVPAADVHVPARQIIELVGGDGALPPLVLGESSGKSRLSVAGADRLDNFVHEGKTIAPKVALTVPKAPTGGAVAELPVRLDGAFPLGTSTGTIRIRAPELSKPIDVEYEIRNKLHWLWILAPTTAGLFLSAALRWVLETRRKLLDARRAADDALALLRAEQGRRADAVLKQKIEVLITTLAASRRSGKDATTLVGDVAFVKGKLTEALADFKLRKDALVTLFQTLKTTLEARRRVPPALRVAMEDKKPPLEAAAGRLDADDADAKPLDAIADDLIAVAAREGASWRTTTLVILAQNSPLHALVTDGTEKVKAALSAVNFAAPAFDAEALIKKIDGLVMEVSDLAKDLLIALRAVLEKAASPAIKGATTSPSLSAACKELTDIERGYEERPDEPEQTLQRALSRMPELLRCVCETLIPAAAAQAGKKQIGELLTAGKYAEALDAVKDVRAAVQASIGTAMGQTVAVEAPVPLGPPLRSLDVPAPVTTVAAVVHATAAAPIWGDLRDALGSDIATQASILLGSWAVVTIVAYLTHAGTFVGTNEEMLSLFSWALGLNVLGTESILALLGKGSASK
jgi:hypothetical protein